MMSISPALRLALALAAAGLCILRLACWRQGNLFHEMVDTVFLVLLICQDLTVLRCCWSLTKGRWNDRRTYATGINALILTVVVVLSASGSEPASCTS